MFVLGFFLVRGGQAVGVDVGGLYLVCGGGHFDNTLFVCAPGSRSLNSVSHSFTECGINILSSFLTSFFVSPVCALFLLGTSGDQGFGSVAPLHG